ncbi:MAG TPA: hypothetical protein VKC61_22885 [Pyrinomonadaceae bacterium]|nr:hypothetical protein [Pyrinomonadaceae bacterium]
METFEQRLKRYVDQDDLEIFGWMTVMMQNVSLAELTKAVENNMYQCVFLCTQAIVQTIAVNMFRMKGVEGTKFYLENFVDGRATDRQFSRIANEIHEMRNVIAHQGYSSLQHNVDFNNEMAEGWRSETGVVFINMRIYFEQFAEAFRQGRHTDTYRKTVSDAERIKRKYFFIRKWLRLDGKHAITREINKLQSMTSEQDIRQQESVIQKMVYHEYRLA